MSEISEFTPDEQEQLVVGLFDRGIIKFGEFTLKSGRKSPIYYNQRPLLSLDYELADADAMSLDQQLSLANLAVEGYAEEVIAGRQIHHLYGIPQAATAIGALVAQKAGVSYVWGRVGKKEYGKHEAIEGDTYPDQTVLQLDDVVTNADSKLESAENLKAAGLETVGFVVMFDRQEGGIQALRRAGYPLSSVTNLSDAAKFLVANQRIGNQEIESLQQYHEGLRDEGVESSFYV